MIWLGLCSKFYYYYYYYVRNFMTKSRCVVSRLLNLKAQISKLREEEERRDKGVVVFTYIFLNFLYVFL